MTTFLELMNLKNRLALVTGANGFLGKEICDTLAELGANLVLVDLDEDSLKLQAKNISKKWDVEVSVIECDLEFAESRKLMIRQVVENFGHLNILVNNAAITGKSLKKGWAVPFLDQTIESWNRAIEVNLSSCFQLSQSLYPLMKQSQGANIINIGSIYGTHGPNWSLYDGTQLSNPAAYGVSKSGLIQLTRWLARTISPEVRVNTLSPGGIFREQEQKFVDRYVNQTPLGRMGVENDFRGPIGLLASDLGKYITGQNFIIDGGWTT